MIRVVPDRKCVKDDYTIYDTVNVHEIVSGAGQGMASNPLRGSDRIS